MFTYCGNNPVNYYDPTGHLPWFVYLGCAVFVVAIGYGAASSIIDNSGANDAEKELIYQDPFAALSVYQAKNTTVEYIDKYYGAEHDRDGTQVNAFRHALWNAIMTETIGVEKAKKFADAHESFLGNPDKHREMDLHNNELGRRIATEFAGQGYDVFAQKIIEAINNGEAKVLVWDENAG